MKVAKFGGTSLSSAEQIRKVCRIITADDRRRLVVVSAPGKRFKNDSKVTDLLICCARQFLSTGKAEPELQAVIDRYSEIANDLALSKQVIDEIIADLHGRLQKDTGYPERFLDGLKAAGEDNSARLVAAYLQGTGYDAHYIHPMEAGMIVSDEPGNAQVLPESYGKLSELRKRAGLLIFPGFFGYSEGGEIVTFSRGGSDITGSILAAAVHADLYENFTDVDSVFAVNPSLIAQPKEIKELTYREMRELSYAGFSVFHEEALLPAFRVGIPVCIKNTNNPDAPGTMIVADRQPTSQLVAGVAADKGFCSIYLSKYLMNREIGFGRKLLQIMEEEQLSFEHTPSGIDHISVVLREDQLDPDKEARVLTRIQEQLKVDELSVVHNLALVMIVGEGMRSSVGTIARATAALAKEHINIEMINQGSSEVSIMFGVQAVDADKAVIALYREFFETV
ncbi:MAG: aspartate kinase [Bacilli bacterium]|nr:aspartate kinase [Bacilli bacterium]